MKDIPDAPYIDLDEEEYNERCNPYAHWEEQADCEAEEADRLWKEEQIKRLDNDGRNT